MNAVGLEEACMACIVHIHLQTSMQTRIYHCILYPHSRHASPPISIFTSLHRPYHRLYVMPSIAGPRSSCFYLFLNLISITHSGFQSIRMYCYFLPNYLSIECIPTYILVMVNRYETAHEWYVICSAWYRLIFCMFYWPVHSNFHIRCDSIQIFNAVNGKHRKGEAWRKREGECGLDTHW